MDREKSVALIGLVSIALLGMVGITLATVGHAESYSSVSLLVLPITLLLLISVGVFSHSGFTRPEILLLISAAIVGAVAPFDAFNVAITSFDGSVLAVNAIGAGVPILLSAKIMLGDRLGGIEAFTGLLVSVYAAYEISTFDPDVGILVQHFTMVPLVSALVAILVKGPVHEGSPPLAYFYGSVGVLVGADLLRLPQVFSHDPGANIVVAVGGVGTADAIFMAGIVAIAMDVVLEFYREERDVAYHPGEMDQASTARH